MHDLNLDHIAQEATKIIKKAGQLVQELHAAGLSFQSKPDGSLVSNADVICQDYLKSTLSGLVPSAGFFAEEDSVHSGVAESLAWVIDPIDGTTNYIRGMANYSISVALTFHNQPVIGIIYAPVLKDCYVAVKNKGAFLNNKAIDVNAVSLANALLLIGVGHKAVHTYSMNHLKELDQTFFSFRVLGSAALDLAYVASGKADIVLHEKLSWWDVAAGVLLITEAGGIVTSYTNDPITPQFTSLVAAHPQLHQTFLSMLAHI